ncbi:MAG: NAD-dependent epimerase/dehydratase family protein [Verrucomicrobia bacterium]|nr:NAD-dependent epimerase/dehydratase family protein [Verrucomicrobiota bacterium]
MSGACLLTGAAGFIGSHLADRLLAMGLTVAGVDNLSLGKSSHLATAMQARTFKFQELDVNDYPKFLDFAAEVHRQTPIQTIWHLAANSDIQAGGSNPDIDLCSTFLTSFHSLKVAQQLGIPEFVLASTSAVYGAQDRELTEDGGPWFPISNYGAMKLASEAALSSALERFLQRAWIFRFPNVVGSRATHGAIFDFVRKLRRTPHELEVLGNGSQEKPYLHVSELIEGMIHLWTSSRERLNYYNIAPDRGATTVRHIAEETIRVVSPQASIRYTGGDRGWVGDVPRFRYSIDKLKASGWCPSLSSDEAVDRAIREVAAENPV